MEKIIKKINDHYCGYLVARKSDPVFGIDYHLLRNQDGTGTNITFSGPLDEHAWVVGIDSAGEEGVTEEAMSMRLNDLSKDLKTMQVVEDTLLGSNSSLSFYKKLSQIQKEMKAPKNIRNEFAKFNYRNAEQILEAVKPLLGDLVLTLSDHIELVGDRYYLVATAEITDGLSTKSVQARAREVEVQKGMVEAQITGSTSSYARKYALNGLFAIDDSRDDPDGRENKEPENKEPEKVDISKAVDTCIEKLKENPQNKKADAQVEFISKYGDDEQKARLRKMTEDSILEEV